MKPTPVTASKFAEMTEAIACMKIMERKNCKSVEWMHRRFVITGAGGDGKSKWPAKVWGTEVVPESAYKDELTPLDYGKQVIEWQMQKRKGYKGMKITADDQSVVFIGDEIEFTPCAEPLQTSLF